MGNHKTNSSPFLVSSNETIDCRPEMPFIQGILSEESALDWGKLETKPHWKIDAKVRRQSICIVLMVTAKASGAPSAIIIHLTCCYACSASAAALLLHVPLYYNVFLSYANPGQTT